MNESAEEREEEVFSDISEIRESENPDSITNVF